MEEDYNFIKIQKEQGKKIFLYVPTWREMGEDISSWLYTKEMKQFLDNNNGVLLYKIHPTDKNCLNLDYCKQIYAMNNYSDIYSVLKYTDALITDYSSVNYDYLLLDKPILYYVPDLKEFQEQNRKFYIPYEEFTAGEVAKTEEELINAMQNVINGIDNYKEQRKQLRDKMFKYQDGHNCKRVVEWIKSLDK